MANSITDKDLGQDQTKQPGNGQDPSAAPTIQSVPSAAPKQPTQKQMQGTGFTNVQRIINANQQNRLGQTIGQGIQNQSQNVQNNLQQANQQFQDQSNQNRFNTDQNSQVVKNVLADPTSQSQQDQNKFSNLISGQYQGPTQLQNQDQLQGQSSEAQQMGQALGSQGGRMGLLQRFVGAPQYSSGQQRLDSLLLGTNGQQDLAAARRQSAGLGQQTQAQIAAAQALGKQYQNEAQGFGQDVQNQFTQNITDTNTSLQNQATQAQAARDAQYSKTLSDLQSGKISQDEANLLGINGDTQVGSNLQGQIGNYVTENADKATAQNIASANDYARLNALQKLAGQYSPDAANQILTNYSGQDAQAGKFAGEQGVIGDKDRFNTDNSGQLTEYHNQLDPAEANATNAREISEWANQRAQYQNQAQGIAQQMNGMSPSDPRYNDLNNQFVQLQNQANAMQGNIAYKDPGAVTNGTTSTNWANANYQSSQDQLNKIKADILKNYGTLNKFQIDPGQS